MCVILLIKFQRTAFVTKLKVFLALIFVELIKFMHA